MRISINDFKELDEEDQYIIWLGQAVLIDEREDIDYYYALYQLDAFYIEMRFCRHQPNESIMKIFSGTSHLDPYLSKMRVEITG